MYILMSGEDNFIVIDKSKHWDSYPHITHKILEAEMFKTVEAAESVRSLFKLDNYRIVKIHQIIVKDIVNNFDYFRTYST